jgi:hypothetical protein
MVSILCLRRDSLARGSSAETHHHFGAERDHCAGNRRLVPRDAAAERLNPQAHTGRRLYCRA